LQKLTEAHRISLLAAAGPFNGRLADRLGLTKLAELDAAYVDYNKALSFCAYGNS
jgi:hypothetical protein